MALIIVMLLVVALAVIAGVFAHSIKVETKLVTNTRAEADLEWLGRSGVEVARWVLGQSKNLPGQVGYDALNQFWAGGPNPTNILDNPFEDFHLDNIELPPGRISIRIIDQERKININALAAPSPANAILMERALKFAGAEGSDAAGVLAAVTDWIDPDSNSPMGGTRDGAEDDYYLGLDPPYRAKNGPIDDITELLKIKGVTPELFWGAAMPGLGTDAGDGHGHGLVDIFCALSNQQVNVNTASAEVLALVFGVDPGMVQETIIKKRAGLDNMEGTEDDDPFPNPGMAAALLGQIAGGAGAPAPTGGAGRLTVQSTTFEVRVDAQIGGSKRRFVAMLDRRTNIRDPRILFFRRD